MILYISKKGKKGNMVVIGFIMFVTPFILGLIGCIMIIKDK